MEKTANGVFLDISDSDIFYHVFDYKFYFSSNFYRKKFIDNVEEYVKKETKKLEVRYKAHFVHCEALYFLYYSQVEKRGFRVEREIDKKVIKSFSELPALFFVILTE